MRRVTETGLKIPTCELAGFRHKKESAFWTPFLEGIACLIAAVSFRVLLYIFVSIKRIFLFYIKLIIINGFIMIINVKTTGCLE